MNPWSLTSVEIALAGALTCAALFALQFVRQRRRVVEVPFPGLWRKVLREHQRHRPWQRRPSLLELALYMSIVATCLGALATNTLDADLEQAQRSTTIWLVDESASMDQLRTGHGPGPETGIDQARGILRRWLAEHAGPQQRWMIWGVGASITTRLALSATLGFDSRAATLGLQASPGEADFSQALRLAQHLAGTDSHTDIRIITDGALASADSDALLECHRSLQRRCSVHWVRGRASNAAITQFSAQRTLDGQSIIVSGTLDAFPADQATRRLEFTDDQGRPLATQTLEGPYPRSFSGQISAPNLERIEVHIAGTSDAPAENLDFDDRARAVIPAAARQRITVLTWGDVLFIEAALITAAGRDEIEVLDLSGWSDDLPLREDRPLDAATGVSPAWLEQPLGRLLANSNIVFISSAPREALDNPVLARTLAERALVLFDPPPRMVTGVDPVIHDGSWRPRPRIDASDRRHPLTRGVRLSHTNIHRARALHVSPGDEILASADGHATIVLRPDPPLRLFVGFAPEQSDWPLRVAFPIFIANILAHQRGETAPQRPAHALGETLQLAIAQLPLPRDSRAGPDVTSFLLRHDLGSTTGTRDFELVALGRRLVFRPEALGYYALGIEQGAEPEQFLTLHRFAVNQSDRRASDPSNAFAPDLRAELAASVSSSPANAQGRWADAAGWRIFLLLGLALLGMHGWFIQRKVA